MHFKSQLHKLVTLVFIVGAIASAYLTAKNTIMAADKPVSEKLLRHVVMFQFKSTSTDAEIKNVIDAFRKLPEKISSVADFEYGQNNSPEGIADGFTHCFFVTFKSEADRASYLPHPAHQEFVGILKPHLEKVMVVDYWAEK